MPIQIYRRSQAPGDSIGNAILQGTQGFVQGRQLRQANEDRGLANAYKQAQIRELERKTQALDAPTPKGYFRDPYSGKLIEDFEQTASLFNGGGLPGGSDSASDQPFVRMGGRTMSNPGYLNPLEKAKLEAQRQKEQEEAQQRVDQEEMIKDSAENMLGTVGEVKKGIKYFGPMGGLPTYAAPSTVASLGKDYGSRRNWEVNVNKLLSGKIVDLIGQMKQASKTGATGFGALSQKELAVLQEASTALKRDLDPGDAERYLNEIERMQRKILGQEISTTAGPVYRKNVTLPLRNGGGSLPGKKLKYEVVAVE